MAEPRRRAIRLRGVVQGVGFRPFVYQVAQAAGLRGWVRNEGADVVVEVQGEAAALESFVAQVQKGPPDAAVAEVALTEVALDDAALPFCILPSQAAAVAHASLPPDSAPCQACREEIATPGERRHRYPFTNCIRCGPRYTIVTALPYDRDRTTLRGFVLCPACAGEYQDPTDRRFHAQPMACPQCGPQLIARTPLGDELLAHGDGALALGAARLRAGEILALKGVGGYQLLVDATHPQAVRRLRARKRRPDKPFAVMFPALAASQHSCVLTSAEQALLLSPAAPIVIVERRATSPVVDEVAPGSTRLGAMLPSSPLHGLLLEAVARPVVCTSGNLSEEPLCIENDEAHARLGGVADVFLEHDRPIARPVDDSVMQVVGSGVEVLRRARGWVPQAIWRRWEAPTVLALGAQLKSTVALAVGHEVLLSQHLGDLMSPLAHDLLARTVDDLQRFLGVRPEVVACDRHPDYVSTRLGETLAARWEVPLVRVQHHHAHVAACMAEHALPPEPPVLGLAWDGLGYGDDGTLWGGEALVCEGASMRRGATLRSFRLPGGSHAVREPRRVAAALLYALGQGQGQGLFHEIASAWFTPAELAVLARLLERGVQAPETTSMGRLFDGIAALAGVCLRMTYEGQAAMALEQAADAAAQAGAYPWDITPGTPLRCDWEPLVRAVLDDRSRGVAAGVISARFHTSLVELAARVVETIGLDTVVLSGGCFQNRRLRAGVEARLAAMGVRVHGHHRVPTNDGGLALGQVEVVSRLQHVAGSTAAPIMA